MRWFCLDTETTGLKAGVDRICSLGAVWFQNGQMLKESHALIDPKRPIRPEATSVHGITDAMVQGCPSIDQVADGFFSELAYAEIIAGYNIHFDDDFLYEAFADRWGKATSKILFIDVLPLVRLAIPHLDSYKLSFVVDALYLPRTANHTAVGDALATCRVLNAISGSLSDNHEAIGRWGHELHAERLSRYYKRLPEKAEYREREQNSLTILKHNAKIDSLISLHKEPVRNFDWSHPSAAHFASGVLSGEIEMITAALRFWARGRTAGIRVTGVTAHSQTKAEILVGVATPDSAVPSQFPVQLKSGVLRWKNMQNNARNELYQDHVCSTALRAAIEVFSFLPHMKEVVVHAHAPCLNLATGHDEERVILSSRLCRVDLERLDLQRVDPSECISAMEHAMRFTKRDGLKPVEKLT